MDYLLPLLFVAALWWISTVLLLYRTGKSPETFLATFGGVVVLGALGVVAIGYSGNLSGDPGVYLGFAGALAVWGFHEASYLLGYVTGPRARACPAGVSGSGRFWFGVKASLYHELAIVLTAVGIAVLTWRSPNQIGLQAFVVLWLMRWSTKINIFLGVRNLHDEYWPGHLQYLRSYARERTMNAMFPWSIAAAIIVIAILLYSAIQADGHDSSRTASMLLLGLMALAMLEHLFLMARLPDDALWRLATRSRRQAG